jgi:undecaprenyl-diphosphatase
VRELDVQAQRLLYGGAGGPWAQVMGALTLLGGGWAVLALVPAFWHPPARRFAALLSSAIAVQSVLVWWIKAAVGRVRPWIALGLPSPVGSPRDGSFPSGHAAGSFCVAAFLAVALPAAWPDCPFRARAMAGASVVLASLVVLSRVYLGAHFPADVLAGGLLGAIIGAGAGGLYASTWQEGRVERATKRR